jgi:hypothetical protein
MFHLLIKISSKLKDNLNCICVGRVFVTFFLKIFLPYDNILIDLNLYLFTASKLMSGAKQNSLSQYSTHSSARPKVYLSEVI